MNLFEEKISQDLKKYDSEGIWHQKTTILLNQYSIDFAGMFTGCGLGQIRNVTIFSNSANQNISKEELLKKFENLKKNGVGAVVCTLGQGYWNKYEVNLLKIGFEKISEYSNYRHGTDGAYKQRLYILKL